MINDTEAGLCSEQQSTRNRVLCCLKVRQANAKVSRSNVECPKQEAVALKLRMEASKSTLEIISFKWLDV